MIARSLARLGAGVLCALGAITAEAGAPGSSDAVVLRDRPGVRAESVVAISPSGLRLDGAFELIGWHRVAAVPDDAAALDPDPEALGRYMALGSDVWRASRRLALGHALLAEAAAAEHEDAMLGQTGPTAAALHRTLLEARLRRGLMGPALRNWLCWADAEDLSPSRFGAERDRGVDALSGDGVGSGTLARIDPGLGVLSVLPPVPSRWSLDGIDPLAGVPLAQARSLPPELPEHRRRAMVLARLYGAVGLVESGNAEPGSVLLDDIRAELAMDPGVALVADMSIARIGDEQGRARARARLRSRMGAEAGGWVEAWCRLGVGWSLLHEADPDDRLLGAIELLHLPARFAEREPYLAGLGLGAAALGLERLGDPGAERLAALLRERYADHPITRSTRVQNLLMMPSPSPAGADGPFPTGTE